MTRRCARSWRALQATNSLWLPSQVFAAAEEEMAEARGMVVEMHHYEA